MASLQCRQNGSYRILYISPDDNTKRPCLHLGRMKKHLAEKFARHFETLLHYREMKATPDADTLAWLDDLPEKLHAKIAKAGLASPRHATKQLSTTLAEFIDIYMAWRTDVKPGTKTNYGQTRRWLIEYFGSDRPLASITPGDAAEFRVYLGKEGLGEDTLRRHLKRAGQFFQHAVKKRIIKESPFAGMKGLSSRGNRDKFHFITPEVAEAVLLACPDTQWRLLFALSRWGGLRCPSEHLALTWDDVNWETDRLTVRSPKTEHHEGKASRVIPIFPELKRELDRAYAEAPDRTVHIITRYRDPDVNLRTPFLRILARAGLKPWPKLFHNLRATRQTELAQRFPAHVVSDWMGNSVTVAAEHYLRTLDSDFDRATGKVSQKVSHSESPLESPAGHQAEVVKTETAIIPVEITAVSAFSASTSRTRQVDKVTPRGFEPRLQE